MDVKATAKYVRVAPNKARQVIRHIKGLGIEEARHTLRFSPKEVSRDILKTLDSAVANAEHNEELDADDLVVTHAYVNEGPTLRRFQPRAMGRAYRIRKRTSHITIHVGLAGPALELVSTPSTPPPAAPRDEEPEQAEDVEPEQAEDVEREQAEDVEPEQAEDVEEPEQADSDDATASAAESDQDDAEPHENDDDTKQQAPSEDAADDAAPDEGEED